MGFAAAESSPQKVLSMKNASVSILIALVFSVVATQAQSSKSIDPISRPRLVNTSNTGGAAKAKFQNQSTQPQTPSRPAETGGRAPAKPNTPGTQDSEQPKSSPREESSAVRMSPRGLRSRINEAERLMKIRPVQTALLPPSLDYVTIATLLPETSQIHLIR
ncbi:MAG: hypothetical protein QOH42_2495, partial [Blastocatellia bacterium]|nr:hypothetical protein [Blastocatellia bacterium]